MSTNDNVGYMSNKKGKRLREKRKFATLNVDMKEIYAASVWQVLQWYAG